MSDDFTFTPGTGATAAADEIAGIKHLRVKVQHGADGSATDVSSASPLPVVTTNAGTFVVQVDGAALTALQTVATGDPNVTPYLNLDLDETGVAVTTVATRLHSWQIMNLGDVTLYFKAYDKASAATAADTPKHVWPLVPGQAFPYSGVVANGYGFSLGLSLRCTTGLAHNDVGAPATNACVVNLGTRAG